MNKLRTIIIDDEQHCIDTLQWQIDQYCPEIDVLACCNSPLKGLKAINSYQPNLVFLDIEMPEMSGFDLLEKIDSVDFSVIFTTAYDQFAVRAFKVSALDYLVKPVDDDELIKAVKKAHDKIKSTESDPLIRHLLSQVRNQTIADKIFLPTANGLEFVKMNDIIRCESESNYTTFYLLGKKRIVVSKTLKEVEDMLNKEQFFRVHHSHIVNLNEVKRYIKGDGGHLILKNEEVIPVSRARKQELLNFLK